METAELSPIDAVIEEVKSRGFIVERIAGNRANTFDSRLLYINGRPCQVIGTTLDSTSPEYAYAKSVRLYLPRTIFPDFLIYVMTDEIPTRFYVMPRGMLSHDTSRTEASLEEYRNAWDLLAASSPPNLMQRHFNSLSPQLQSIMKAAMRIGLEVETIRTERGKKRNDYRHFFQRRVLIAGRKCAVYSASRVNKELEFNEHSVVVLKAPIDSWADFQLYLVEDGSIYVIPRGHISTTTTLSLNSLDLRPYRNAWDLLQGAALRPEFY